MRKYGWKCARGHEQGVFRSLAEAKAAADMTECYCGAAAWVFIHAPTKWQSIQIAPGDAAFKDHYNYSLGMGIETARQLREVQARYKGEGREIQTYEPIRDRSSDWMEKGNRTAKAIANVENWDPERTEAEAPDSELVEL